MNEWNGYFQFHPRQFQAFFRPSIRYNIVIYQRAKYIHFRKMQAQSSINWTEKIIPHSTFFVLLPIISPFYIKQKVCESLLKMVRWTLTLSFTTSSSEAILMEIFCFFPSISFFFRFEKRRKKKRRKMKRLWYWRSRPLKILCHP